MRRTIKLTTSPLFPRGNVRTPGNNRDVIISHEFLPFAAPLMQRPLLVRQLIAPINIISKRRMLPDKSVVPIRQRQKETSFRPKCHALALFALGRLPPGQLQGGMGRFVNAHHGSQPQCFVRTAALTTTQEVEGKSAATPKGNHIALDNCIPGNERDQGRTARWPSSNALYHSVQRVAER